MITRRRAAMAVIKKGQLLLIYRRKKNLTYYSFPGGGVEPGETHEQAALRELYEETSVKAELVHLLGRANSLRGIQYLYLGRYQSGTPKLHPDSAEYQRHSPSNFYRPMWIDITRVPGLRVFPPQLHRIWLKELPNL